MGALRADTEQRNRRLDRFPGIPRLRPLSSHLCVNWKPLSRDEACLLLAGVAETSLRRQGNLIAPTEDLQEILHRVVLCSRVLCGLDLRPCSLPVPDLFSGILHGPYLCPRVMDGPDVSVFLHGPKRCSGI